MNTPQDITIKRRLMSKAAHSKTPLCGIFELTPRCNMNCKMCYIRMSEEEMKPFGKEKTADEWISFGKECTEKGMLFLLLTGGEPFIRPDFHKIYSAFKAMGLFLSINTNAVLITDDDIDFLKKDRPESVNITLYGASNETYKKLCRIENGFSKVTENIIKLKKADIPVAINVSMTKENVSDLEAIINFGKKNDIPVKVSSYMFNPVRKTDGNQKCDDVIFSAKESGKVRYLTMKYVLPDEKFQFVCSQFRKNDFSVGVHGDECEFVQGYNMNCMAGKCSFWITWSGKMLPCGMINEPCALPFENGFDGAWKFITDKVEKITLAPECRNCPAISVCHPCGAMAFSENRNFSKKPEYLCESTKEYIRLMKSDSE